MTAPDLSNTTEPEPNGLGKSPQQWRVGIVGLGAAAKNIHLPAYRKLKNLQLVGGYDADADSDKEGYDFPVFSSVEQMIQKTHPDILTIATPPATHHPLAILGLEAGCHIFCEKPFTETLDQARQINALAKKLDRRVVVNNQYRFMNIHRATKQLIGDPDFGDLLFLHAEQTFFTNSETEAGWRGQDPQRVCKEFGTHVIDLCRFFFDEDPTRVMARMPNLHEFSGTDLLCLIWLDFSGDRMAQISLDRLSRGRHRYLEIRLDGTQACIETRLGGGMSFSAGIRGGTRKPFLDAEFSLGGRALLYQGEKCRKIASDPLDIFASATASLMEAFLDALEKGATPPCDGLDNARTLAVMLAAYESNAKQTAIEISYD
jgi:predicted dehydrogenase